MPFKYHLILSSTDKAEVGIKISEDKKRSLDLEKLYHGSAEWSEEGRKIKDMLLIT